LGGNVINLQTGQVRERTIHDLWSFELPFLADSFHMWSVCEGITNFSDDHKQSERRADMMDFHNDGGYFLGHTTARLFWSDLGRMNGKSALFALFKTVLGPLCGSSQGFADQK
jgi:hypothetical protein